MLPKAKFSCRQPSVFLQKINSVHISPDNVYADNVAGPFGPLLPPSLQAVHSKHSSLLWGWGSWQWMIHLPFTEWKQDTFFFPFLSLVCLSKRFSLRPDELQSWCKLLCACLGELDHPWWASMETRFAQCPVECLPLLVDTRITQIHLKNVVTDMWTLDDPNEMRTTFRSRRKHVML